MKAPEVPVPDRDTRDWWEATREHRLMVQKCGRCANTQHPPRSVCIGCGRTDALGLTEVSGLGTVDSWTVVHRPPRPELDAPYVIARVRVDEGVICLTRLEGRLHEEWSIGDRVSVDWVDLEDGRSLPVFVPVDH